MGPSPYWSSFATHSSSSCLHYSWSISVAQRQRKSNVAPSKGRPPVPIREGRPRYRILLEHVAVTEVQSRMDLGWLLEVRPFSLSLRSSGFGCPGPLASSVNGTSISMETARTPVARWIPHESAAGRSESPCAAGEGERLGRACVCPAKGKKPSKCDL